MLRIWMIGIAFLLESSRLALPAALIPISGTPHADLYEAFRILRDANTASDEIVIVPKTLEFERDDAIGRTKFGLQYSYENNSPFASLVTSVRPHFEKTEVDEIVNFVSRDQPGVRSVSPGGFQIDAVFFVDIEGKRKLISITQGAAPLEASIAVTVDLSFLEKSELHLLLSGEQPSGGIIASVRSSMPIGKIILPSPSIKALYEWLLKRDFLTVYEVDRLDKLGFDVDSSTSSQIAQVLGPPDIMKIENGYSFGWNIAVTEQRQKLDQLFSNMMKGTITLVSENYYDDDFVSMNSACVSFSSQIVNLSTLETGCEGLSHE